MGLQKLVKLKIIQEDSVTLHKNTIDQGWSTLLIPLSFTLENWICTFANLLRTFAITSQVRITTNTYSFKFKVLLFFFFHLKINH